MIHFFQISINDYKKCLIKNPKKTHGYKKKKKEKEKSHHSDSDKKQDILISNDILLMTTSQETDLTKSLTMN